MVESNHRPTFGVVDISYDDFGQNLQGFETEAFGDNSKTESFRGDSERVTPRSTLVTLPIFVIGFSSTIVICALFVLFSEFRARQKYDRKIMTESSSGVCNNMKSSAQSSNRNISTNCRSSEIDGVLLHNGSKSNGSERENDDECGNNHVCANGQPFLCDKNLHRDKEIFFYRSEDSFMSIASTITESLPSHSQTRCNKDSDCIMELTDIYRVSTSMALEDLVELGTISATKYVATVVQDEGAMPKLPDAAKRDIKDNCNNEAETKDREISDIDVQRQPGEEPQNSRKRDISDFDAGNFYITEVMANEECSFSAETEDTGDINIQAESAEERVCECKDLKREDSLCGNATTATPNIPPSSASSDDDLTQVTAHGHRGSLNSIASVEELESPTMAVVLGEQSQLAMSKQNRSTKTENDHRILEPRLEKDDCASLSGITEASKRRTCDDWVDLVRSSSCSSSMDASTKTIPKSQEGQMCQQVDRTNNDLND